MLFDLWLQLMAPLIYLILGGRFIELESNRILCIMTADLEGAIEIAEEEQAECMIKWMRESDFLVRNIVMETNHLKLIPKVRTAVGGEVLKILRHRLDHPWMLEDGELSENDKERYRKIIG